MNAQPALRIVVNLGGPLPIQLPIQPTFRPAWQSPTVQQPGTLTQA